MRLTKQQKILQSVLEEKGYLVRLEKNKKNRIEAEIENWTEREEDMIIYLSEFSVEELDTYAQEYDIDDHIEMMMQSGDPNNPKSYRANFTYAEALEDQKIWLQQLREDILDIKAKLSGKTLRSVRVTYRMEIYLRGTDADSIRQAWENADIHGGEFVEVVSVEDADTNRDLSQEIQL